VARQAPHSPPVILGRWFASALAMRASRSSDFFVLALACLEAAIRDEFDLLELLPDPKPTPTKPISAMALAS
jgi:hypothetical protein